MLGRLFFVLGFAGGSVAAQAPIDVVESTLKIQGLTEEILYYGFAAGDQMVFNFQTVDGKELKELEIVELPAMSKFADYKTKVIDHKTLSIQKAGIYKFRFYNSAIGARICKIKIQRIPIGESTRNFNTAVYWRTVYDTTHVSVQESFLEKTDTVITSVVDQVAKVSSQNAINGASNKNVIDFSFPAGTIFWSYYIGVGQEGAKAYEAAKDDFVSSASSTLLKMPEFGPLAALALTGINAFAKVQGSDNVKYYFITDWDNVLLFNSNQAFYQYKQGDVINDASRMSYPLSGKIYLGLLNDNVMDPIDVVVKVTVIQVNKVYGLRTVDQINVSSRQEAYLKD